MKLCDIINIGCENMLLYNKNKIESDNGLLSATRPHETILKTGLKTNSQLQTRLKQKSVIKIYVEDDKYYVEHSAAYALGLIKTRAIMTDNPKLIEITGEIHNRLKSNDMVEIEYIKIEKKQQLKVYVCNSQYCIDYSAAYALGFLTIEEFANNENNYYYITEQIINNLKEKYNIEFHSLTLEQNSVNKRL